MTRMDWVRERARCTAAHYFDELVKTISRDVERFNRLETTQERKRGFKVVCNGRESIEIRRARMIRYAANRIEWSRIADDNDFIAVWRADPAMHAKRDCFWNMEVLLHWNSETLAFDMILDGEARTLDYISQYILGDFMLEDMS